MKNLMTIIAAAVALSTFAASPALAEKEIEITATKAARFESREIQVYAWVKNNTAENTGGVGRYVVYKAEGKKMVEVASGSLPAIPAGASNYVKAVLPMSGDEETYEINVSYKSSAASAKAKLAAIPAPKKPTLTLLEWKAITPLYSGGLFSIQNGECRIYASGQMYPFEKMVGTDRFKSKPRLLTNRPVVVQLWQINSIGKDVKLGQKTIDSTQEPGEHTITFSGTVDDDRYKYTLTYRIDAPK